MDTPTDRRMVRIFMPKVGIEDIEKLKTSRAFLLRTHLPKGAHFIAMCSVPSIIDMVGFSGGGGPPAFAYLINPDERATDEVLFMTCMPEAPFTHRCDTLQVAVKVLGVVQCMGMLLTGFVWGGIQLPELERQLVDEGAYIFDTQPYVVPAFLQAISLQKMAQVQAQHEKTSGKSAGSG